MNRRRSLRSIAMTCLLAALALQSLHVPTASACSCAASDHASAVAMFASSFRGRVTSVVRQGDDEIATFVVLETYRGVAAGTQTIAIHYYVGISPCPIPRFSVGQVARVYANPSPEGLRVHFCNPSGRDPA